ncbi:conserved hypothetical protein [Ricinus communis]|uniref:UspA domain-containing protein n=1 Tax=Ricinus communis TaxID=3988 RepID=B9SIH5_RICCO|nr:conserved hypothetical protein [Ricinus communis]
MKERLFLEVERLGLSVVILGSRGFGAVKRGSDGRLGNVSDYCIHHYVFPVVVVRYLDDNNKDEEETVINVPVEEDVDDAAQNGESKGFGDVCLFL